jgi:hypothetical protein
MRSAALSGETDQAARTGGKAGLMLPISILPASAKFSAARLIAGKLGLMLPIRTLARSSMSRAGIFTGVRSFVSILVISASDCSSRR